MTSNSLNTALLRNYFGIDPNIKITSKKEFKVRVPVMPHSLLTLY